MESCGIVQVKAFPAEPVRRGQLAGGESVELPLHGEQDVVPGETWCSLHREEYIR